MLEIIQTVVGLALFFGCGYSLSLAFFPKGIDEIERVTLSLVFSISFPTLTILFTNLLLKIPINTLTVYLTYVILTTAGYLLYKESYRSRITSKLAKLKKEMKRRLHLS